MVWVGGKTSSRYLPSLGPVETSLNGPPQMGQYRMEGPMAEDGCLRDGMSKGMYEGLRMYVMERVQGDGWV